MKIIICDDNDLFLEKVTEFCIKLMDDDDMVKSYKSSNELLRDIEQDDEHADLFILDVEIPEINGLEIRNRLEKSAYGSRIVFLTAHQEFMMDAFGKYVIAFVDKSNYEERLPRIIQDIRTEINKNNLVKIDDGVTTVFLNKSQIISITSEHVYTKIKYIKNEGSFSDEVLVRISLSEWQERLGDDFFRVNNSSLVNFSYISMIKEMIILDDGTKIKIPRKKREYCCEQYAKYCMRKSRFL